MSNRADAFDQFARGIGPIPNWLGVVTRREFFDENLNFVALTPPAPRDSEYFEWLDLIETVVAAGPQYTMVELGAGFGRWTVNAAAAVRTFGRSRYRLVAVEPEPTHFQWARQHCRDNNVRTCESGELRLIEAAVTADGDPVDFGVGNPAGWYGQAIADGTWSPAEVTRVDGIRLSELARELQTIDLVHADIQGAELAVFSEAVDALDVTTARLHIGTHNAKVEQGLRELLNSHGWRCIRDYGVNSWSETSVGQMNFQDGIQTWVNLRLNDGEGGREYDHSR